MRNKVVAEKKQKQNSCQGECASSFGGGGGKVGKEGRRGKSRRKPPISKREVRRTDSMDELKSLPTGKVNRFSAIFGVIWSRRHTGGA